MREGIKNPRGRYALGDFYLIQIYSKSYLSAYPCLITAYVAALTAGLAIYRYEGYRKPPGALLYYLLLVRRREALCDMVDFGSRRKHYALIPFGLIDIALGLTREEVRYAYIENTSNNPVYEQPTGIVS